MRLGILIVMTTWLATQAAAATEPAPGATDILGVLGPVPARAMVSPPLPPAPRARPEPAAAGQANVARRDGDDDDDDDDKQVSVLDGLMRSRSADPGIALQDILHVRETEAGDGGRSAAQEMFERMHRQPLSDLADSFFEMAPRDPLPGPRDPLPSPRDRE